MMSWNPTTRLAPSFAAAGLTATQALPCWRRCVGPGGLRHGSSAASSFSRSSLLTTTGRKSGCHPTAGYRWTCSSWQLAGGRLEEVKWSCYYRGRLDLRMKTECLPHVVIGIPGVRVPRSWYMVPRLTEQGSQTSCYALQTRQLLYQDTVEVERPAMANLPGAGPGLS